MHHERIMVSQYPRIYQDTHLPPTGLGTSALLFGILKLLFVDFQLGYHHQLHDEPEEGRNVPRPPT